MRILLFNLVQDFTPDGGSTIAAILKRAGHQVTRVITMRTWKLKPEAEDVLDSLLQNTDLVMMSVYTVALPIAIEITDLVHRRFKGLKVIWGGPHCIASPAQSLDYADAVCFSEADTIVEELVDRLEKGEDWQKTLSLAYKVNGQVVQNEVSPPLEDLDSLPFPDMSLENHYLLGESLEPLTEKTAEFCNSRWPLGIPMYPCITTRGCPHLCTYCNNARYVKLYGRHKIRFSSIEYMIQMLENVLAQHKFIKVIFLYDDDFMCRPKKDLIEFSEKYKSRVGLPFVVNVSANTFRDDKFQLLLDAGLKGIQMGIQSGSERVLSEVYNRRVQLSKIRLAVPQMASREAARKNLGFVLLDLIVDNPYETPDDIIESYRFLLNFHSQLANRKAPWVSLNVFFLTFSPGTELMEKALRDGFVKPEDLMGPCGNYRRRNLIYQQNYETFLILLLRYLNSKQKLRYVPCFAMRLLGTRIARSLASLVSNSFYVSAVRRIRERVMV